MNLCAFYSYRLIGKLTAYSFTNTHSPITLTNFSSISLVCIFRCSSPPRNTVYARRVDLSDLAFSLSSHRHSHIQVFCLALASSFHNKQSWHCRWLGAGVSNVGTLSWLDTSRMRRSGLVLLVVDLRNTHDRFGSSSDPSLNGHLHYPNDIVRSLN